MANSATHKAGHRSVSNNFLFSKGRGQIAVFTLLLMGVVVIFMMVLTGALLSNAVAVGHAADQSLSQQLAESGVDRALWCLNHPLDCPANYTGETQTQGKGTFTVATTTTGNSGTIESTGTVNGKIVTVRTNIQNTSTTNASFYYGVQSGTGGILMNNNSKIVGANGAPGNVYVNGSVGIAGGSGEGTEITGDAVLAMSNPTIDVQSDPPSPYTTFDVRGTASTRYVAQSFTPTVTDQLTSISFKIARTNNAPSNPTLSLYYDNGSGKPGTMIPDAQINLTSSSLPVNSGDGWKTGFTDVLFTPNTMLTAGVQYWIVLQVSGADGLKYFTMVRSTDDLYTGGSVMTGSDLTGNLQQVCTPTSCDLAVKVGMGGIQPTLEIEKVGGAARSYFMQKANIVGKAYYHKITGNVQALNGAATCDNGDPICHCADDQNGPNCFDLDVSGGGRPRTAALPTLGRADRRMGRSSQRRRNRGLFDALHHFLRLHRA